MVEEILSCGGLGFKVLVFGTVPRIRYSFENFFVWYLQGIQRQLPLVFLRGSNIRFVHIPDNVDIMQLVEDRVSVDARSRNRVLLCAIICSVCFEDALFLRFEIWC